MLLYLDLFRFHPSMCFLVTVFLLLVYRAIVLNYNVFFECCFLLGIFTLNIFVICWNGGRGYSLFVYSSVHLSYIFVQSITQKVFEMSTWIDYWGVQFTRMITFPIIFFHADFILLKVNTMQCSFYPEFGKCGFPKVNPGIQTNFYHNRLPLISAQPWTFNCKSLFVPLD